MAKFTFIRDARLLQESTEDRNCNYARYIWSLVLYGVPNLFNKKTKVFTENLEDLISYQGFVACM